MLPWVHRGRVGVGPMVGGIRELILGRAVCDPSWLCPGTLSDTAELLGAGQVAQEPWDVLAGRSCPALRGSR